MSGYFRGRKFDRTDDPREVFSWIYIRQNAETALWVFLSPLSGFWWASGKVYPLFDPFYGGSRYIFGKPRRDFSARARGQAAKLRAASGMSAGTAETQSGSGLRPASPTAESGDAQNTSGEQA